MHVHVCMCAKNNYRRKSPEWIMWNKVARPRRRNRNVKNTFYSYKKISKNLNEGIKLKFKLKSLVLYLLNST